MYHLFDGITTNVMAILKRTGTQHWNGTTKSLFGQNLVSFHPMVLKKNIFKDFHFPTNHHPWWLILNVRQCYWTPFWKRTIQKVSHPSLKLTKSVNQCRTDITYLGCRAMSQDTILGEDNTKSIQFKSKIVKQYRTDTSLSSDNICTCLLTGHLEEL